MFQPIDLGAAPNDHSGDDLRTGGQKINDNFGELYGLLEASVEATEAIGTGDYVNVYETGGNARVRLADGTDPTKFVTGYAPAAIANGATGLVRSIAAGNDAVAPAQTGEAFLSVTVPGGYQFARPSAGGQIVQSLGVAVEGVGIFPIPAYLEL